jgi:hypothetical protein
MQNSTSDLDVLAARVETLEKQNRFFKRGGLALLCAAASLIVMGQARPNNSVEAQSYILRDASGAKRAELVLEAATPGATPSPTLRYLDEKGAETLTMSSTRLELAGQSESGSNILLDDSKGVVRADLGLDHDQPFVLLADAKGISRVRAFVDKNQPAIVLQDAKAIPRVGLGMDRDQPSITVNDSLGSSAVLGSISLVTTGTGQERQSPAASLYLFDKDGKVLWSAP